MYNVHAAAADAGHTHLAAALVFIGCSTTLACQEVPDTRGTTRLKCGMNHLFRIQDVCVLCKIQRDSSRAGIEVSFSASLKPVTIK
ncbi:hypothetical protein [Xanthomonas fragariae]|uniref:hypothetical protein n=1 Tax=Xanthomonas fragariae TaxID=48664 RepID=UPI000A35D208|nr:hypothetical protein [Xanthomonas fragariae]MDM7553618.1 hypothetical protein [Xanthomonas fragariae]MDM7556728.1 hypothetical protein [Xanthomonas fragariae]MDM7574449.1 hypothetical protein [Xanthomonas fragariae]MDM7577585.1 hypothetical protein [Xanthomonas fragariae]MDM7587784.1 hypothetical protein [Xanthomonas fragariae]